MGLINGRLVDNSYQQAFIAGSLISLMLVAYIKRLKILEGTTPLLKMFFVYYGYVMMTVAWSSLNEASLLKAILLFILISSTYIISSRLSVREFTNTLLVGLAFVSVISLILSIVAPSLAYHAGELEGNLKGIYNHKQILGIAATILGFISLVRLYNEKAKIYFITLVVSVICLLLTGSRGALILMAFSFMLSVLPRQGRAYNLALFIPLITALLSGVFFMVFGALDASGVSFAGEYYTLNSRTYIWNYALQQGWLQTPILGTGLNNFWSNEETILNFSDINNWSTENFHNGYLAVLVEQGLLGYSLFVVLTAMLCNKLKQLDSSTESKTIVGYTSLFYLMNIYETFLIRSTSGILLIFLFFVLVISQNISVSSLKNPRGKNALASE